MNKITLLIPNYNNAQYLEECLISIKKQTFKDFDILIIDDGSTDQSISIINNFDDNRIKLIKKEKNSGIVDTLNIGLENIITKYMVRMDGDDTMREDRIEKLFNFMENNPEFGVCGSGMQQFGKSNNIVLGEKNPIINRASIIFSHAVSHASSIFRMKIINDHHIRYQNQYYLLEDYKLFYDLSNHTKITCLPDLLYEYRQEDYNIPKNYLPIRKPGFIKIYTEILSELKFKKPEDSAEVHFELFKNTNITNSKSIFKSHIKQLIHQNNKLQIFPIIEFNNKIMSVYKSLFYKLKDQGKLNIFEAFEFFIKSPKKIYYFIKK